MAAKKPRVLIIGAGMAGITAANRLHSAAPGAFELAVVEGGTRIGGRICTAEFGGDRIEMGATWIHGIGGSPVHAIAAKIGALDSDRPWECMDGSQDDPARLVTVAEGRFVPDNQTLLDPISELFNNLMSFVQKNKQPISRINKEIAVKAYESLSNEKLSVGAFLTKALSLYQAKSIGDDEIIAGDWTRNSLEKALFEVFENTQRTYTSAGDLATLDYVAESEYRMCSDEEITIGRGYSSVIEHLASSLPPGMIRLGKKVETVEWGSSPVKVRFSDGTCAEADHVVVTVSLGVLKAGAVKFAPALPEFKSEAIARLGFGVVNKLFVKLANSDAGDFPFLRMAFHKKKKKRNIPNWMRKTASMFPIYDGSSVLLSWFAGAEALELESLGEDEIKEGVSETITAFVGGATVEEILRSRWGNDPLFLGSYSYVAVGSSGDDLDAMAEPLPKMPASSQKPLQILFAGEATHRTHYSTTHGAYFSGLREGNRLLRHYNCLGF